MHTNATTHTQLQHNTSADYKTSTQLTFNYKTLNIMKNLFALIAIGILILSFNSCETTKQPVPVDYVKQHEIMLPDYACPDTLIVMDAATLNSNLAYYEQKVDWGTDADIDSLLHCKNKQGLAACLTFTEYVQHLEGEGYRPDIALHIANVDFGRAVKDMKYIEIMED